VSREIDVSLVGTVTVGYGISDVDEVVALGVESVYLKVAS
jgi:hypothetical protein